ncbi:MAG: DUF58 domain-containing protein [Candidatus Obscuribacterales bacterium]|nr:DUF58 domain-containing protein [Candidatus Obscuribacterales bacterium]
MIGGKLLYFILGLAALLFLASFVLPWLGKLALVIDAAVFLLLLFDYLITPQSNLLSAQRIVSERLSIGRKNDVQIELFSQAGQPLNLRLRDSYPQELESDVREFDFQISAGSKARLEYTLLPRRRGAYEFKDIYIRYRSRLALFWRELRVPAAREIRVYPDLKALQELSVKLAHSSELGDLKVRKRGQGTDFATLREYVSGDDVRSMDWKATARRDRPVLRVYEVDKEQTLMVLVDAGRMMLSDLEGLSRFDHALNAALSLVLTGLMRNDSVGLGIFADKPILYMPPRRGKSYLTRILEACCDIAPKMVEPDYLGALAFFAAAQKSRSLMVVLSDLTDPTGSQSLLSGLGSLSPRHLPFCVTLRDRQVDQISESSADNLSAIMKRAVATDLIAQRELAFSHLIRRGCLLLDCPPQELSSKLVDKYLEIKARSLI